MLLPILPEAVECPLDKVGLAGCVAVYRPMDVYDKSRWFDETSFRVMSAEAQVYAVRRQLVALRGLEIENEDKTRGAFDPANDAHFKALPVEVVGAIFGDMLERTQLTEGERKN